MLSADRINLLPSFRSQHHVTGTLVVLVEAMATGDAVQVRKVHPFVRCVHQEHDVLTPAFGAIRAERMLGMHNNSDSDPGARGRCFTNDPHFCGALHHPRHDVVWGGLHQRPVSGHRIGCHPIRTMRCTIVAWQSRICTSAGCSRSSYSVVILPPFKRIALPRSAKSITAENSGMPEFAWG